MSNRIFFRLFGVLKTSLLTNFRSDFMFEIYVWLRRDRKKNWLPVSINSKKILEDELTKTFSQSNKKKIVEMGRREMKEKSQF